MNAFRSIEFARGRSQFSTTFKLTLLVGAAVMMTGVYRVHDVKSELKFTQQAFAQAIERRAAQGQQLAVNQTTQGQRRGAYWPALFAALESVHRSDVRLGAVRADRQSKNISIEAYANDLDRALRYSDQLDQTSLTDVTLLTHERLPGRPQPSLKFALTAVMSLQEATTAPPVRMATVAP